MLSDVAGTTPEAKSRALIGCGGAKTGFRKLTASRASLNEALPSGADKTTSPSARPTTNWLRLREASRLIRFALGLQWVSNSARPWLTRSLTSGDGLNLSRLLAVQKITLADRVISMRRASSSRGECHPLIKPTSSVANSRTTSEAFKARSGSILRAETIPTSLPLRMEHFPLYQSRDDCLSRKGFSPFGYSRNPC